MKYGSYDFVLTNTNSPSVLEGNYSRINYTTFYDNSEITSVNFSTCTYIGESAFRECSALITANFPVCTSIGSTTFFNCSALTGVSFPACTTIGISAFESCSALTTASFPACTSIGNYAFANCSSLTTASFPVCISIGYSAFYNCTALTTVDFPACTNIGSFAFQNCNALTTVDFPACTNIGSSAFVNCRSLTTVDFPACTSIGSFAFHACISLTTANFPACTAAGSYIFYNCTALTTVDFPVCTSIGSWAFYCCSSLTTASFPACTYIDAYAFYDCYNLVSFYLLTSSVPYLSSTSAFTSTPISTYFTVAGRYGSIFVRASMLTAFQNHSVWKYFFPRMVGLTNHLFISNITDDTVVAINGDIAATDDNYWVNEGYVFEFYDKTKGKVSYTVPASAEEEIHYDLVYPTTYNTLTYNGLDSAHINDIKSIKVSYDNGTLIFDEFPFSVGLPSGTVSVTLDIEFNKYATIHRVDEVSSTKSISLSNTGLKTFTITIPSTTNQRIVLTANGEETSENTFPWGTEWSATVVPNEGYIAGTLNKTSGTLTDNVSLTVTAATIRMLNVNIVQTYPWEISAIYKTTRYTTSFQVLYNSPIYVDVNVQNLNGEEVKYVCAHLTQPCGCIYVKEDITIAVDGDMNSDKHRLQYIASENGLLPNDIMSGWDILADFGTVYNVDLTSSLDVVGFARNSTAYEIPARLFYGNSTITSARGDYVSAIGASAFYNCSSLNTASFPACTYIYGFAFYNCSSLATADFPACTYIGNSAFYSCSALTTAIFPACTSIGNYAFANCSSLTTASFPVCTTISSNAFYNCTKLTTVSFPACTHIVAWAFYDCLSLTTADFPACTLIDDRAFLSCTSLTTVNFPACTTISYGAFYGCTSLTTVSFPACTYISDAAFYRCYNLVSFYLLTSSVPALRNSIVFSSTPIAGYSTSAGRYGSIFVKASLLEDFKTATYWSFFSSRFVGV